ncbi:hypothetical protein [Priestia megaterium]
MELIFSEETLNDTDKQYIVNFITKKIEEFDLVLKDLEKIVLTKDYFKEVKQAYSHIGKHGKGASNNSMAEGMAIVVHNKAPDPKSKAVVLINENEWRKLLSKKQDEIDFCTHVINHELAHVHDDTLKHGLIYSYEMKRGDLSDLNFRLRCEADKIWSEYVAERLSSPTVTKEFVDMIKNNMHGQMRKLFYHYPRTNGLLLGILRPVNYNNFESHMGYGLKTLAQLLGISHGLGENHDWTKEIDEEVREVLKRRELVDVWDSMGMSLSSLYDEYPAWDDIQELDELGESILQSWKCFGYFD